MTTCRLWVFLLSIATLATPLAAQFYFPDSKVYATPDQVGLKYEQVTFTSKDGTKLSGWFVPATKAPLGTVVHFHGNAQNMTAHFSFVSWLPKFGFNVFVFDYRGYGASEGTLDRVGIHEDSIAALTYIKSRTDIQQDRILVFGQSLGGANAIAALATSDFEGIRGIVTESAFYSYKDVAKDKAPEALVDIVVSDDYSPGPLIERLAPIPLLIIHGTSDTVVPYSHGQRLFRAAGNPKTFWTVKGGQHTSAFTTFGRTYRPRLVEFFKACLGGPMTARPATKPATTRSAPSDE